MRFGRRSAYTTQSPPLHAAGRFRRRMQHCQEVSMGKPAVAIVDDDPAVRSSLKFSLELEGFAVSTYADAAALLDDAGSAGADCLIIDYKLPGMNGIELLNALRSRKIDAPVVLITSNPSRSLRAIAQDCGATLVEKPLLGNALNDSVREAVGMRRPGSVGN
jgi:FixJ family two-component response regulator